MYDFKYRIGISQHLNCPNMMIFSIQGAQGPPGFPGTPGDPGAKGEKVRYTDRVTGKGKKNRSCKKNHLKCTCAEQTYLVLTNVVPTGRPWRRSCRPEGASRSSRTPRTRIQICEFQLILVLNVCF